MSKSRVFLFILFSMILITGCGEKRPKGMPPLVPVQVHIAYDDGSPVSNALLSFKPESGPRNWSVAATTDAEGNAEVRTHGRYKGMPAGNWKIVVQKDLHEGIAFPGTPDPNDPEGVKAYDEWKKSPNKQKVFSLVEEKYRNTSSTPLQIKVEGKASFDFKAGKPCKIKLPDLM